MRRLYMLLPELESCLAIVEELRESGVPDSHLHVVANLSCELENLPRATLWQKTELAHGIEIGTGLGGVAGLLGGLLALSFPPAGLVSGGGAVLASTAAGAGFGALASAMMKSHEPNHRLHDYHDQIEAGKILLMVDVPRSEVEQTRASILQHHPEARIDIAAPKR